MDVSGRMGVQEKVEGGRGGAGGHGERRGEEREYRGQKEASAAALLLHEGVAVLLVAKERGQGH